MHHGIQVVVMYQTQCKCIIVCALHLGLVSISLYAIPPPTIYNFVHLLVNIEAVIITVSMVPSDRSAVSQSRIRDDRTSSVLQLYSGEENMLRGSLYELWSLVLFFLA